MSRSIGDRSLREASEKSIQRGLRRHRQRSLATYLLRIMIRYPALRPALLKLASGGRSKDFFSAVRNSPDKLPLSIRIAVAAGETILPEKMNDRMIRFVIERIVGPYFLLPDEKAYTKVRYRYERRGSGIVLDIAGEEAYLTEDADAFMQSYVYAMQHLCAGGHMAVKLSALVPGISMRPSNHAANKKLLKEKLETILEYAHTYDVSIVFDAEERFFWGIVDEAFFETVTSERWSTMQNIGIAIQAYRQGTVEDKSALNYLEQIIQAAKDRGHKLCVRWIKGAYWETERALADQNDWDFPLFSAKEKTDANFRQGAIMLLENSRYIDAYFGTHNPEDIAFIIAEAKACGVEPKFQMLRGIGESLSIVLSRMGVSTLIYSPLKLDGGEFSAIAGYLARRLCEFMGQSTCLKEVV